MMVSPRKSWRISIVAGFKVATEASSRISSETRTPTREHSPELSSDVASSTMSRFGLNADVENATFVDVK